MSYALQVHFRQVLPSEGLIALAAARYALIRRVLTEPGECTVSLEREAEPQRRALARAVVKIYTQGRERGEASASHRDPEVALELALDALQEQLGARWSDARTRRAS